MSRTIWTRGTQLGAAVLLATSGCYVAPAQVASRYVKSVPVQRDQGAITTVTEAESPELAGTTLVIEPGALPEDETITVEFGLEAIVEGRAKAAGPVAVFGPAGLVFNKPARMKLPFQLGADQQAQDLFVQVSEADGRRFTIARAALEVDGSSVAFDVSGFTAFQPGTSSEQQGCTTNSDCASGDQCVNGACQPMTLDGGCATALCACQVDADCGAGYGCVDGGCTHGGIDGGPSDGGGQCSADWECQQGEICVNGACYSAIDAGSAPDAGTDAGAADAGVTCISNADCLISQQCIKGVCQ